MISQSMQVQVHPPQNEKNIDVIMHCTMSKFIVIFIIIAISLYSPILELVLKIVLVKKNLK